MMTWSVVLGVSFWVVGLMPSEVGPAYPNNGFLPAVRGSTPDCVKDPRDTFCIDPKKYPKERIVYLLENKMFDIDSLLMDETRDSYTFEARDSPTQPPMMYDYEPPRQPYEPPGQSYGPPRQTYGPPRPATGYLPPPRQNQTTTSKPYGSPHAKITRTSSRRQRRQATPTDLCPYESEYIMPRAALNNKGDWMFLVNLNEVSTEYTQLVESKKCLRNTCSGSCSIPDGFNAVCQQQYVQKRLIALDGSGTMLATDTFWFPSCCVCKLRQIGG
ncbi:uncharacterized protein [Panulirus ornatus]|uniref:uncharacterized protein isoform X3 n=1 Tax=Panulirus ornatus TaxID=150431 RepID=UPI003A83BD10